MFKIIFVLVINTSHGGITTMDFTNRQQCETAKEQIKVTQKGGWRYEFGAVCVEKQIPIKKTKCTISNKTDGSISNKRSYPVAFECVEE